MSHNFYGGPYPREMPRLGPMLPPRHTGRPGETIIYSKRYEPAYIHQRHNGTGVQPDYGHRIYGGPM